jgi:hypothetical protein
LKLLCLQNVFIAMIKFITGEDLEKVVYDIIWDAENVLLIVSPFIKLDEYFKRLFDKHVNNNKLHLIVVFGKNEGAINRSLSKHDFEYFKKFLNVSVVYVPNLHAKYYGNEKKGVITSINLHDYSFKNNIEFGVYSEVTLLNDFTTTADQKAWDTCLKLAGDNEVIFVKRPVYEKKLFSALLGKNYIKSDILYDITDEFNRGFIGRKMVKDFKTLNDFPDELELGSKPSIRPSREEVETLTDGFCIRTGVKIPYNPKRPYCEKAYESWAQYGNVDYPERYCHKTGVRSNGKTTKRNPIL